jgi:hypothetical protein
MNRVYIVGIMIIRESMPVIFAKSAGMGPCGNFSAGLS